MKRKSITLTNPSRGSRIQTAVVGSLVERPASKRFCTNDFLACQECMEPRQVFQKGSFDFFAVRENTHLDGTVTKKDAELK